MVTGAELYITCRLPQHIKDSKTLCRSLKEGKRTFIANLIY